MIQGYSAGDRLKHTQFVWIWESQVCEIPADFERQYTNHCTRHNLDPNDEDNMDEFIAERLDMWDVADWVETSRETQTSDWEKI